MRKKILCVLGACTAFAACNSDTFVDDGGTDSGSGDVVVIPDASDASPADSGPPCQCDSDAGACYGSTCVYPMTTGACLVTAGQYVYWTNGEQVVGGGAVYRMHVVTHAVELVASGQQTPRGITTDDGTNVYWTFGGAPGGIMRVAVAGGTPSKVIGATDPVALGIAGSRLYYGLSDTSVYSVGISQTGAPILVDTGNGLPLFMHAGASGARMYWTAQLTPDAGNIMSAPTDGGLSRTEYSPLGRLAGFVAPPSEINPLYVYVKNDEIDSLLTLPVKVVDAPNAFDLSEDTTSYYWSEQRDAGAIRKRALAPDASVTLATDTNPLCIAPLSPTIYWTAIGRMIPGAAAL